MGEWMGWWGQGGVEERYGAKWSEVGWGGVSLSHCICCPPGSVVLTTPTSSGATKEMFRPQMRHKVPELQVLREGEEMDTPMAATPDCGTQKTAQSLAPRPLSVNAPMQKTSLFRNCYVHSMPI